MPTSQQHGESFATSFLFVITKARHDLIPQGSRNSWLVRRVWSFYRTKI